MYLPAPAQLSRGGREKIIKQTINRTHDNGGSYKTMHLFDKYYPKTLHLPLDPPFLSLIDLVIPVKLRGH
ncbi:hypothetical protein BRADI_3g15771v3 [Brachypodium distachyon]|uniref:Uncharacterized protein n=1 Tax=Brachypodium distachyon TaxID=15368 RepID=A0A0Q3LRR0_BRADI|nr:hypothetical protein BRADI_3g15771v3 [Brachypodium distachyon]